jgi:rhodanese-related sulfurtransferase
LFNGLDGYLAEVPEKDRNNWTSRVSYHAINAPEFDRLAKQEVPVLLDVRKAEEFSNHSKESFRNIGNLKGAVSIPFAEWDKQFASLSLDKHKPIVVYAMSSQNEVFEAAKKLTEQGFTNVSVLMGGLFNLRWRAANVNGFEYLKGWVVNVPPDNQ